MTRSISAACEFRKRQIITTFPSTYISRRLWISKTPDHYHCHFPFYIHLYRVSSSSCFFCLARCDFRLLPSFRWDALEAYIGRVCNLTLHFRRLWTCKTPGHYHCLYLLHIRPSVTLIPFPHCRWPELIASDYQLLRWRLSLPSIAMTANDELPTLLLTTAFACLSDCLLHVSHSSIWPSAAQMATEHAINCHDGKWWVAIAFAYHCLHLLLLHTSDRLLHSSHSRTSVLKLPSLLLTTASDRCCFTHQTVCYTHSGLAISTYMNWIWPYVWWFPCRKSHHSQRRHRAVCISAYHCLHLLLLHTSTLCSHNAHLLCLCYIIVMFMLHVYVTCLCYIIVMFMLNHCYVYVTYLCYIIVMFMLHHCSLLCLCYVIAVCYVYVTSLLCLCYMFMLHVYVTSLSCLCYIIVMFMLHHCSLLCLCYIIAVCYVYATSLQFVMFMLHHCSLLCLCYIIVMFMLHVYVTCLCYIIVMFMLHHCSLLCSCYIIVMFMLHHCYVYVACLCYMFILHHCHVYVTSLSCLCYIIWFVMFMLHHCHVYVTSLSCLCYIIDMFMLHHCYVHVSSLLCSCFIIAVCYVYVTSLQFVMFMLHHCSLLCLCYIIAVCCVHVTSLQFVMFMLHHCSFITLRKSAVRCLPLPWPAAALLFAATVCSIHSNWWWHTFVGLARTIYMRCIYKILTEISLIKNTVIYGVCLRSWPTLYLCNINYNTACARSLRVLVAQELLLKCTRSCLPQPLPVPAAEVLLLRINVLVLDAASACWAALNWSFAKLMPAILMPTCYTIHIHAILMPTC